MYNTKNYMEQGGEKLVIGGTLEIKPDASVTGLPTEPPNAATEISFGCVKAAPKGDDYTVAVKIGTDGNLYVPAYPVAQHTADSEATTIAALKDDLNSLLAKLRSAGLIAIAQSE